MVDVDESDTFGMWRLGNGYETRFNTLPDVQASALPSNRGQRTSPVNASTGRGSPTTISLREAVCRYKQEERSLGRAYSTYVRDTRETGAISIGPNKVKLIKSAGIWMVNREEFDQAVIIHRKRIEEVRQVTVDYSPGILHGSDGKRVETE